ncbi:uncharacterized protein [Parasteatoda tepidariorum]|uniref:uncharacterized protein isoform X2 n=1 Tax=Parasteatoda tepidariorum TaxID=114398 RepID=UPI00077F96F1
MMTSFICYFLFLVASGQAFTHRLRRQLDVPHFSTPNESPFFLIQPMSMGRRRLILTLPNDNIEILNAEATPERGQAFLPTTLSLRESDSNNRQSYPRGSASRSRFHYSEEHHPMETRHHKGAQVTFIKAKGGNKPKYVHARKVMTMSYNPMKATIIKPQEAKRVRVIETESESVTPMKARIIKPQEPMISIGYKAKTKPVSFKKGHVEEDWADSNIHLTKTLLPETPLSETRDDMLLNCGGTNDLGWCDLGTNYPNIEVSQIMDVCEELVNKMFVEVPDVEMEDIASYSLSRNITQQKKYYPRNSESVLLKKSLCELEREIIQPSFAQDIEGKWHVIIQTDEFPQRVILEVCKNPGEKCKSCNSLVSQCVQKYSHHKLLSFDPESAETCPYIRLYKFPTACVCRIN